MTAPQHFLRPNEIEEVLKLILAHIPSKDLKALDEKKTEDFLNELSEILKHTFPSNAGGKSIDPHVLKVLKLVLDIAITNKNEKNPEKKVDLDMVCRLLKDIFKNVPEKELEHKL